jgi:hypothetical protein
LRAKKKYIAHFRIGTGTGKIKNFIGPVVKEEIICMRTEKIKNLTGSGKILNFIGPVAKSKKQDQMADP